MRSFDRSSRRRSSGRSFDRRDSGDFERRKPRKSFDEPIMHGAICDKCGKSCEVPFKPNPNKPVYCSDCFRRNDNSSNDSGSSNQFDEINRKLDKILKLLE